VHAGLVSVILGRFGQSRCSSRTGDKKMSRKLEKFTLGPQLGYLVVFGDADWEKIEKAYTHKLSDFARRLISIATLVLTLGLPIERNAPTLAEVTDEIEKLIERAELLREKLFSPHHWRPEYQPYQLPQRLRDKLIIQLQELDRANIDEDERSVFRISLTGAIESGLMFIERMREGGGAHEGNSWDKWVVWLTLVMQAFQLPTGIRSEVYRVTKGRPPEPSAFVKLLKALEGIACPDYHRSQTDGGLAKAIGRARTRYRADPGDPEKVEHDLFAFFGLEGYPEYYQENGSALEEAIRLVVEGTKPGIVPFIPEPFYTPSC
jgi:hypothetical protein